MSNITSIGNNPLNVEEVISCFRERWGVSYDLKLRVRNNYLYLQIMWAYLEQQSFPMDEEIYIAHLNSVLEIINRLGQAELVREWIREVTPKPRIGRALSLQLKTDSRLEEFVL